MSVNLIFNRAHEEEVLRTDKAIICFTDIQSFQYNSFKHIYSSIANDYKNIKFFIVDITNKNFLKKFNDNDNDNENEEPIFIFLKNSEKINEIIGIDLNKFISFIQLL